MDEESISKAVAEGIKRERARTHGRNLWLLSLAIIAIFSLCQISGTPNTQWGGYILVIWIAVSFGVIIHYRPTKD